MAIPAFVVKKATILAFENRSCMIYTYGPNYF